MLQKLIFIMEEVIISPNQIIFNENDIEDQSIYFIKSGIIEIYYSQSKFPIFAKKLTQNQLFGELSFFSGLSRKASARSVNLSTLYKIQRNDFLEILKENKEDFEVF